MTFICTTLLAVATRLGVVGPHY